MGVGGDLNGHQVLVRAGGAGVPSGAALKVG